jgi:assimilatory nitrate reductase catalytic subunit
LFNGMLHVMLAEGLVDKAYIDAHTEGFPALEKLLQAYTPSVVAGLCDIDASLVVQAAHYFGRSSAALSLYCQGLNQSIHGTHNNAALIHLHLATGQIGKPGAGPFSLTGQPNAMGGREVGGLSNLLSAHRDLANPQHRAEVAKLWGIPAVPEKPGKAAVDLFQSLKTGEIKAVWIACTNPAQSLPNQKAVREALSAAEFVVLQEAFADTDTAAFADLLLPATTWGEKQGTVTNSERRITRVKPAVAAPGEARDDWAIAAEFARRLGRRLNNPYTEQLFPYADVEAIFNEHRETTRGRDLDITGLSYALLEAEGPQQWPFPAGAQTGKTRLYEDGVFPTATGRAKFVPVVHQATADTLDARHPVSLLSGRMRDQWHGMSRTGNVPRLYNLEDEPVLAMHPCDMRHRQLESGDLVRVANERGETLLRIVEGSGLKRGRAWLPMHWGSQFMNSAGANALTPGASDPYSFQPELKHAAVEISKAALPYPLVIIRRCPSMQAALQMQQQARALLARFPYASLGLYGRSNALVVFRAATAKPVDAATIAELDAVFGLEQVEGAIHYADARRHISKKALVSDGRLLGVRLVGETLAQQWLKQAMAEDELDAALVRMALAPSAKPPAAVKPRNIICKCADVSDLQIAAALAGGADFAGLQEKLKCGTFCGSCVPDLKRMQAVHLVKETEPA